MRKIAALFVSGRSIYKHLPDVEAWDRTRDAAKFTDPMPVIAHPPCRTWSKNLSHQARPVCFEKEQDLARFAVKIVMQNGGVLEQPAESKLWEDCQLPRLNDKTDPFCYSMQVEQRWFGYGSRKKTWLLICGVPRSSLPAIPFRFDAQAKSDLWDNAAQRSRTEKEFAEWLCQVARSVWWRECECQASRCLAKLPGALAR
jgi:hypothetical protein